MRITFKDWITDETIRQKTQQVPVSNRIKQMRLKCVCQWNPTGKRSRGRPNKSWMDCVEEDLRRAGVTECGKTTGRENEMTLSDIAADRQQRMILTAAIMAEISWTMNTRPDLVAHLAAFVPRTCVTWRVGVPSTRAVPLERCSRWSAPALDALERSNWKKMTRSSLT